MLHTKLSQLQRTMAAKHPARLEHVEFTDEAGERWVSIGLEGGPVVLLPALRDEDL